MNRIALVQECDAMPPGTQIKTCLIKQLLFFSSDLKMLDNIGKRLIFVPQLSLDSI